MTKTMMTGSLALVALAAAAGFATAQDAPAQPDRSGLAHHALRTDTDNDGRISQAEFVQGQIARLTAADADGDGTVTADEMRAVRQARMTARAASHFDRMDTDRDGMISRAEFEAKPTMRVGRAGPGHREGRSMAAPRGERRADAGGEGGRTARGPVVIADVQTKMTAAFARLDTDRDGYITATERQAARAAMREGRQERRAERMSRRQSMAPVSPQPPVSE